MAHPARLTRLVLIAPNGARVELEGALASIDLTGTPNADARIPLEIAVEQLCDMGQWHAVGRAPVPLYDT